VSDYLVPGLFLCLGLAIGARSAWLRAGHRPVPTLLRVTGLFALGVGAFLAALLVMCNP
jgi:hypothetical protein